MGFEQGMGVMEEDLSWKSSSSAEFNAAAAQSGLKFQDQTLTF